MAEESDSKSLADERTDFAEDRTVLANERTFAGWMRTGLAAVGIGVGFNALFDEMEPSWLPRVIATCFILAGLTIFYLAEHNSSVVLKRLNTHAVRPVRLMNLRLVASVVAFGSLTLLFGLWFLV